MTGAPPATESGKPGCLLLDKTAIATVSVQPSQNFYEILERRFVKRCLAERQLFMRKRWRIPPKTKAAKSRLPSPSSNPPVPPRACTTRETLNPLGDHSFETGSTTRVSPIGARSHVKTKWCAYASWVAE